MNCPKCGHTIEDNNYKCDNCHEYYVYIRKPDIKKRFLSSCIDGIIVFSLCYFFPYLSILGAFYILFKDIITKNGSIGKIFTGLIILDMSKKVKAGFKQKIARNLFLSIGLFFLIILSILQNIYIIGFAFKLVWILSFALWMTFIALEAYYIYTDENGQRLSDRLAKTTVM
ncbi:MAG: zinc ribbon domain-containing protein [Candidatus Muirbacterium halophilum]|nr:zinc ribbon domain-containing protein [Candidatus Muirbacterium halophilum]MCK9474701.1 zinc ribbon domain-containing protein [Candidatus Muirbacterium halophilum]